MKKMNTMNTMGGIPLVAVLLLVMLIPVHVYAAENQHLENISRALETSALVRTDQAEVRAKAASALNAGVPADDVEIIVSRALKNGANAGTINRFLELSTSTKKEGLPVGPVTDRIEQGLSKNVPPERIAAATQRLSEKLTEARPVVDKLIRDGVKTDRGSAREEAISSSARAMERSFSAGEIENIGSAVKERKGPLSLFTTAVDTAAYVAGNGASVKTATGLVRQAVERGYTAKDLDTIVKRMNTELKRGTRAEDAAASLARENMQGDRSLGRQDMMQDMKSDRGMVGAGAGMGGRMK